MPSPPADRYLELFTNVQKSRIFADIANLPRLRAETRSAGHPAELPQVKRQPDFDLRQFVEDNFGCRRARATSISPTPA